MNLDNTISIIKEEFLDKILDHTKYAEENILHIKGKSVLEVLSALQNNGFNFLADITAIDNLSIGGFERYSVVYHLLSHETAERVTVKAYVPETHNKEPVATFVLTLSLKAY